MRSPEEKSRHFWSKVAAPNDNGCRLWTGNVRRTGYGLYPRKYGTRYAARIAWEFRRGPIPAGLVTDHWRLNESLASGEVYLCSRLCVEHIRLVTLGENSIASPKIGAALRRGNILGAERERSKTHCLRGHAYDAANTDHRPSGGRRCRKCKLVSDAKSRQAARKRRDEMLAEMRKAG